MRKPPNDISVRGVPAFIAEHRARFGVAPICRVLTENGCQIAPRTFYAWLTRPPSARTLWDTVITEVLAGFYEPDEHGRRKPESLYGATKMWAHLQRVVMQCTAPNLVVFKRLLKDGGAMNPGLPPTQIEETEVGSAGGALRTVTVFVRDWDSDKAASKAMGMVRRASESLQDGGPVTLISATEVACSS